MGKPVTAETLASTLYRQLDEVALTELSDFLEHALFRDASLERIVGKLLTGVRDQIKKGEQSVKIIEKN